MSYFNLNNLSIPSDQAGMQQERAPYLKLAAFRIQSNSEKGTAKKAETEETNTMVL